MSTALEPLLLSCSQVGALIGVSRSKVFQLLSEGKLPPSFKIGGSRRFKRNDVLRWIELNCPNLDTFCALTRRRA